MVVIRAEVGLNAGMKTNSVEPISKIGVRRIARDLAWRLGVRRENIPSGSSTDEQRSRRAKDPQGVPLLFMRWVLVKIDPEIMGGTPCFAGTRVPARTLGRRRSVGRFAGGFSDGQPGASHCLSRPQNSI